MKKCVLCKIEKALADFNKKASSVDGKQNVCRDCNKVRSKRYYKDNHDKHRKAVAKRNKNTIEENRKWLAEYFLENPCVDCGISDILVLEFDHLMDKREGVGRMIAGGWSLITIKAEIAKCEVRCRNCHQIKTFERMGGTWHDKFLETIS